MMSYLERAHAADIRIRTADERLPPDGVTIDATDVTESLVYEQHGARVVAFDVDHGEYIKPALATASNTTDTLCCCLATRDSVKT
jgi:ribonuclease Z